MAETSPRESDGFISTWVGTLAGQILGALPALAFSKWWIRNLPQDNYADAGFVGVILFLGAIAGAGIGSWFALRRRGADLAQHTGMLCALFSPIGLVLALIIGTLLPKISLLRIAFALVAGSLLAAFAARQLALRKRNVELPAIAESE